MNNKELLFCNFYAKLRNGKDSAVKAGYPEYSAQRQANKLLLKDEILKQIESITKKQESLNLKSEIIQGLKRLAFNSNSDSLKLLLYKKEDLIKISDELDIFHISEIKIPKDGAIEIKFFDRYKALELLAEIAEKTTSSTDAVNFLQALNNSAQNLLSSEE